MEQMKIVAKKQSIPGWLFCFIYLIVLYVTNLVAQDQDLDLGRYYELGDNASSYGSIKDVIKYYYEDGIDFIYYVILYITKHIGLDYNFITALIVSLYYFVTLKTAEYNCKKRIEPYLLFVPILLPPIIWVVAISRNLTAILFLYIAIMYFYKRKWIFVAVFLAMCIFTHFSMLMYIAVIAVAWLIQKNKVNKRVLFIAIGIALVLSVIVPDAFRLLMDYSLSDTELYYAKYSGKSEVHSILSYGKNYGQMAVILFGLIYSIGLLLLNKKQGFEFWALFMITVMYAFFLNTSLMFVNRCMMVFPMFWALNMADVYTSGNEKERLYIRALSICGSLAILMFFYAERPFFLPYLY